MRFPMHIPTISTVLLLAASAIAQTTVTIPCSRDNSLYEDPAGALSGGAGTGVYAGVSGLGLKRRGLLYFDVAANIPSGALILGAQLTINVPQSGGGLNPVPITVHGHRLLQNWGEGTSVPLGGGGSGAPSTPNDATWIHTFYSSSFWTNPGGDFAAAASFTIVSPPIGLCSSTPTAAIANDVQAWLANPAQNFGWLLKTDETQAFMALRLDSRENTLGTPPSLQVTYIQSGQTGTWGQGCPVNGQPFALQWSGAPIGPTTVQLVQSNGPAGALAANLLSLGFDRTGFPLLPQCNLNLPLLGVVNAGIFTLSAAGTGTTNVNIPSGYPGLLFASQTAALFPSPAGYVLSNTALALLQ
ncbi:MAG: DNRLRE domain-containing protein [Planctomycetota bacterium]